MTIRVATVIGRILLAVIFTVMVGDLGAAGPAYSAGSMQDERVASENTAALAAQPAWYPLGSDGAGTNGAIQGDVYAVAVYQGDLYIGGRFRDAAGIPEADFIARWDGSGWSAVGTTGWVNGEVRSLTVFDGDLYVGGGFTNTAGIATADYVARWNGTSWSAVGGGFDSYVYVVAAIGGTLYAGGDFLYAGGVKLPNRLARWAGDHWASVGSDRLNDVVFALAGYDGALYVGGNFTNAAGIPSADYLARWDGTTWSATGNAINGGVFALQAVGDWLYAGGYSFNGRTALLSRFDGTSWESLLGSNEVPSPSIRALTAVGTDLYVGGDIYFGATFLGDDNGTGASGLARWDGATWSAVGSQSYFRTAYDFAIDGSDLYVGGTFANGGGIVQADSIARYGPIPFTVAMASVTPGLTADTEITMWLGGSRAIDCSSLGASDLDIANGSWSGPASEAAGGGCAFLVSADAVPDGEMAEVRVNTSGTFAVSSKGGDVATTSAGHPSVWVDHLRPAVTAFGLNPYYDSGSSSQDGLTRSTTIRYVLELSEWSTGVTAADFSVSGTATGCLVAPPYASHSVQGSGELWDSWWVIDVVPSIAPGACSSGTIGLTLAANSLLDRVGNIGPTQPRAAGLVTIDRTAPTDVTLSATTPSPTKEVALTFRVAGSEDLDCGSLTASDFEVGRGRLGGIGSDGAGCDIAVTSDVALGETGDTTLSASSSFTVADEAGNTVAAVAGSPIAVTVDRVIVPDTTPPEIAGISMTPTTAAPGAPIAFSADVTDDHAVASAQVRVGDGSWVGATPADSAFDSAFETVIRSLVAPTGSAVDVCVRAADPAGNVSVPACQTLTISGASSVASGGGFTCVLLADTTVRCFGDGSQGQLGTGTTSDSPLPVAVRTSGDAVLSGVTALTAGTSHACALKVDRTVVCWGDGAYGKLGNGRLSDVLYATPVSRLSGVTAISAGADHTCALRATKTVSCWGKNSGGQLGDGSLTSRTTPVRVENLSGATVVIAGGGHSCAVVGGAKTVRCWGVNSDGQLGDGTRTRRKVPVPVKNLSGVTWLAAGGNHSCARLSSSAVRCWGDNSRGQLGDNTLIDRLTPVAVRGISTATSVEAGSRFSCAVLTSGAPKCWGDNAKSQLGDGTTVTRKTPVAPGGALTGKTVLVVSGGVAHTCVGLTTGAVLCWGDNITGQLGNGTYAGSTLPAKVRRLKGDASEQLVAEPAPTENPGGDGAGETPAPTEDVEPTPGPSTQPGPKTGPDTSPTPSEPPIPSPSPGDPGL